ncbi:uncharacterized protein PV06_08193 [Exophiala oligosperma]|uniref:Protein kinase domain-containing protein n=1 Tax=Exophiala oligosperma TaxID=215243 RepID=A0A0D2DVS2_9EURO|nr:uncharacterized protein PV06_08193 [Exophiala oligosperma]KIW39594.1 hypothetical protein PV06_08193 [Exophiala oligosperma]
MAIANPGAPADSCSPSRFTEEVMDDGWICSSMRRMVWLHLDGTIVNQKVIGLGSTGLVIEQGRWAIKIPYVSRGIIRGVDGLPDEVEPLTPEEGDYDDRIPLIEEIQCEKAMYRRLGNHHGIVRCHDLESTDPSIRMDRMSGDLRHFLDEQKRPTRQTQLRWFVTLAHTMAYIHEHRIIIADVRLDNLLLDDHLAIKFCDFAGSTLMPLEWDLHGTDDFGYSILIDIGQFGAVMYQVITGKKCKFELGEKESDSLLTGTRREDLPSTEGVWLGHIIENCWTMSFKSSNELAAALDQAKLPEEVQAPIPSQSADNLLTLQP